MKKRFDCECRRKGEKAGIGNENEWANHESRKIEACRKIKRDTEKNGKDTAQGLNCRNDNKKKVLY